KLLHLPILEWYENNARDLPWRTPDRTPWGVLVSEIMLQQTPVSRVLPVWHEWMARWPTPKALAAEPSGEAVRAWGRLGYPRRAPARRRRPHHRAARRRGPVRPRDAPLPAGHRRVHGRRRRQLRVRGTARHPGHERTAGAGTGGTSRGVPPDGHLGRRTPPGRS